MSSKDAENMKRNWNIDSKQIQLEIYSKELSYEQILNKWHNLHIKASAHMKECENISCLALGNQVQKKITSILPGKPKHCIVNKTKLNKSSK